MFNLFFKNIIIHIYLTVWCYNNKMFVYKQTKPYKNLTISVCCINVTHFFVKVFVKLSWVFNYFLSDHNRFSNYRMQDTWKMYHLIFWCGVYIITGYQIIRTAALCCIIALAILEYLDRRRQYRGTGLKNEGNSLLTSSSSSSRHSPGAASQTSIPAKFTSSKEYGKFFQKLISAECVYNRERESFEYIVIDCVKYTKKTKLRLGKTGSSGIGIFSEGVEVWVTTPHTTNAIRGAVTYQHATIVDVELNRVVQSPSGTTATLKKSFNKTPYGRMKGALTTFAYKYECVSPAVRSALLAGGDTSSLDDDSDGDDNLPENLLASNLPGLNEPQLSAVRHALRSPVGLIQGPPGTGKTVTSATIIYNLSKTGTVLVCAPSNNAVDNLARVVAKTGVDVVRLVRKTKETVDGGLFSLYLAEKIKQLAGHTELKELQTLVDWNTELSPMEQRSYDVLTREAEIDCLKKSRVVLTTCCGAGDSRLEKISFSSVVIDECAQATEPECVIPIVRGATRVVLIGDHCQLGPVVLCPDAVGGGLDRSMFERLITAGVPSVRLTVQYRMHPEISNYSSMAMYDGTIVNGVTREQRTGHVNVVWPNPNVPMAFYSTDSVERKSRSGTSYVNYGEANVVQLLVARLVGKSVHPDQIGVITPCEGQRTLLTHVLKEHQRMEVSSVDAFQGREKEYVIISCVRSNKKGRVGFLDCDRRLNVALTRAKFGLFLVGNTQVLAKNHTWNKLLRYYEEKKLIVQVSVDD